MNEIFILRYAEKGEDFNGWVNGSAFFSRAQAEEFCESYKATEPTRKFAVEAVRLVTPR
jgi:hypothetical protein